MNESKGKFNAVSQIRQILDQDILLPHIDINDIPGIDLYMDQVTTFMEDHLGMLRRSIDDKILTKTMINNYAKNRLLPPPAKKKYSREHMLMMMFIYYFKGFLNLQDIKSLLDPLSETYFHAQDRPDVTEIYSELQKQGSGNMGVICQEILDIAKHADETFSEASEEDQDFLRYFALISYLSIDVYVKKHVIEKLIDQHEASVSDKKGKK